MKTVFHTRNDELQQDDEFYFILDNELVTLSEDGEIKTTTIPLTSKLIDDKVLEYAQNFKYEKPTLERVENFIFIGDTRGLLRNGKFINVKDTDFGAKTPVESNLLLAVYETAKFIYNNK